MLEPETELGTSCDNPRDDGNQQERPILGILRDYTLDLDKKFRIRDLAYTAGMLDGEGCITGSPATEMNRAQLAVFISSSHMPVLEWLKQTYGGGTRSWNGNKKGKHVEKWYVPAKSIIPFLHLMVPFLIIKQPQAYKAMVVRHLMEVRADPIRISDGIREIQAMNQSRMI
jgi:hypothetical protein